MMGTPAKPATRSDVDKLTLGSFDEWWAVEGTVAGALDGFALVCFDLAGKCLLL